MMQDHFKRPSAQQNSPERCAIPTENLDTLSPVELAENLELLLSSVSDDSYDPELIDAYLDALDRKAPMAQVPDTKADFLDFQQRLREMSPDYEETPSDPVHKWPVSARRLGKSLLVAAVALVVMLAMLVGAQAAGLDVFGAMARWTEEVFSLGPIRYVDDTGALPEESDVHIIKDESTGLTYSSMREALDAYGATDVAMPTWIPEGYDLNYIDIVYTEDPAILCIIAEYLNNSTDTFLNIYVSRYDSEPNMQVELANVDFTEWEENGLTFYLVENSKSATVSWCAGHYECYISTTISDEELLEMVHSIFD